MNPLAPLLNEVLNAMWDDPKYKELRDRGIDTLAKHAMDQLTIMKGDEKLAPLLMQMAIAGFTEEDYERLEKAIQPKFEQRRKRQAEQARDLELQMRKMQLDTYRHAIERASEPAPSSMKTNWRSIINKIK